MKKTELLHILPDWLSGRLSSRQREALEQQLSGDPELRAWFNAMAELLVQPGTAPVADLEPDPYLPARLKAHRRSPVMPPAGWWRLSFPAAGLVVAITLGVLLGREAVEMNTLSAESQSDLSLWSEVFDTPDIAANWPDLAELPEAEQ